MAPTPSSLTKSIASVSPSNASTSLLSCIVKGVLVQGSWSFVFVEISHK
jgi:hypothetical protein